MRKTAGKKAAAWLLCVALLLTVAPASLLAAADEEVDWKMEITQVITADSLSGYTYSVAYDGTVTPIYHNNVPAAGNCFVLITAGLTSGAGTTEALDTSTMQLHIGSESYNRVADDSFLSFYQYTRLPLSTLVSDSGTVCFEVPVGYLDDNGTGWWISAGSYRSDAFGGTAAVPYKQNLVDDSAARESAALTAYISGGTKTLDDAYIIQDLYGNAPLTAVAVFETDTPVSATVLVHGKTPSGDISYTADAPTTHHEVQIFGLYADYANTVTITADGVSKDFQITTEAFPETYTVSVTDLSAGQAMVYGGNELILVTNKCRTVFDCNGEMRWYTTLEFSESGICELEQGSFWAAAKAYTDRAELYHVSFTGKVLGIYSQSTSAKAHHDAVVMPGGEQLLYFYKDTALGLMDIETGAFEPYLDFADVFTNRISYEPRSAGTTDWLHANNVEYYLNENSEIKLILSFRNQHMVAQMDYATKTFDWVLTPAQEISGVQEQFRDVMLTPEGSDFCWGFSQHDPSFISYAGGVVTLTMFDNGVARNINGYTTPAGSYYSQLISYEIDTVNLTAETIYTAGGDDATLYSSVCGSSQYLEGSGNYLGGFYGSGTDSYVVEFDPAGTPLWRMHLSGQYLYRANLCGTDQFLDNAFALGGTAGVYYYPDKGIWGNISFVANADAQAQCEIYSISTDNQKIYLSAKSYLEEDAANSLWTGNYLVLETPNGLRGIRTSDADATGRTFNIIADIPADLPNGAYPVQICTKNINGRCTYVDTGYYLQIGTEVASVESADILEKQARIDAALTAAAATGSYTLDAPYIMVDPYGLSPLSAYAIFDTPQAATVSVCVKSKAGAADILCDFTDQSTSHVIPIYGLYANEATDVVLTVHNADGSEQSSTVQVTGANLSSVTTRYDTDVEVTVSDAGSIAPGWTFFTAGSLYGYTNAVDENGDFRWFMNSPGTGAVGAFLPLENGRILTTGNKSFGSYYMYSLWELDLTGKIYEEYVIDGLHHDVIELANGNLLVLANNINGSVKEDTFFEIDRQTGSILRTWDLNAYFNVSNVNGNGEHISDVNYGAATDDWFHNNSLDYRVAEDGSEHVILSGRHQDAVIALNLTTGELEWILSDPAEGADGWNEDLQSKLLTPQGDDFLWQYGQHCAKWLPNGDLALFDNGNFRTKSSDDVPPAATEGYSRMVIYHIDAEAMTVSQVYEFGREEFGPANLSPYISSVQYLGEDHYLIDFGGIEKTAAGDASYSNIAALGTGTSFSRTYELVDGQVVAQIEHAMPGLNGNTYRAQRFSTPYLSNAEPDLSIVGTRLGGLFFRGAVSAESALPGDGDFTVTDLNVSDDGVHLSLSATTEETGEMKLFFQGSSLYSLPVTNAGGKLTATMAVGELAPGEYSLYLVSGNETCDLSTVWNNVRNARAIPTGYDISVNSEAEEKGSAFGGGRYYANTPVTVTAYAKEGYVFSEWMANGQSLSEDEAYSFTPTSDLALTAKFITDPALNDDPMTRDVKGNARDPEGKGDGIPDIYQIRVVFQVNNGTIDGASEKIAYVTRYAANGDYSQTAPAAVTFPQVSANSGYTTAGAAWSPEYATVNEERTYQMECVPLGQSCSVNVSCGANGSCAQSGSMQVNANDALTLTPKPDSGYATDTVSVNGVKVAPNADGSYTAIITGDGTVEITFGSDSNADGVPDRYQKYMMFEVKNGTWDGSDGNNKFGVVTLYDANGLYDENGTGNLTDILPDVSQARPNEGYTVNGAAWDPANVLVKGTQAGQMTYEFPFDPGSATTEMFKYDYNRNGTVDSADILMMRKLMANVVVPAGDQRTFLILLFDANGNGVVDSADILRARKQMAMVDQKYKVAIPDRYLAYFPA